MNFKRKVVIWQKWKTGNIQRFWYHNVLTVMNRQNCQTAYHFCIWWIVTNWADGYKIIKVLIFWLYVEHCNVGHTRSKRVVPWTTCCANTAEVSHKYPGSCLLPCTYITGMFMFLFYVAHKNVSSSNDHVSRIKVWSTVFDIMVSLLEACICFLTVCLVWRYS